MINLYNGTGMLAHSRKYLFSVALLLEIGFGVCFDGSDLVGQWATDDSWIESIINSQEIFRIDQGENQSRNAARLGQY